MTATLPPAVTRAGSMRILLATHFFYPNIGGLETVARVLADEFTALGHEVVVVTQSPPAGREGLDQTEFAFPGGALSGPQGTATPVRWCDVYFQNNISLRTLWPLLLARRPWVVSHQTWLTRVDGRAGWQDRLKKFLIRFGSPIAISRAVAAPLPVPATLIGNPYQDKLFRLLPGVPRRARSCSWRGWFPTRAATSPSKPSRGLRARGLTPTADHRRRRAGTRQPRSAGPRSRRGRAGDVRGHADRRNARAHPQRTPRHGRALAAGGTLRRGGAGRHRVRLRDRRLGGRGAARRHRSLRRAVPQRRRRRAGRPPGPRLDRRRTARPLARGRGRTWTAHVPGVSPPIRQFEGPSLSSQPQFRIPRSAFPMLLFSHPFGQQPRPPGRARGPGSGAPRRTLDVLALDARRPGRTLAAGRACA